MCRRDPLARGDEFTAEPAAQRFLLFRNPREAFIGAFELVFKPRHRSAQRTGIAQQGCFAREAVDRGEQAVSAVLPLVAIVLVILIVGGIVGGAKAQIAEHAGVLLLATFLLHAVGFALGYALARLLGLEEIAARTISIEVGMQNSGLGSGLAKTPAFAAQFADITQAALAPVPAAISAVWHVLIGSLLAGWWRQKDGRRG